MPTVLQTFRHLRRYQQVGRILTRYGFGYFLTQLGIGRAIAPGIEKLRFSSAEILRATPPERLRMVVEELGPTFIKLGQILSTRGDLLPPEFIHELEKLQDTVPPTDFALIQAQVERELKKPLAEVFPHFDPVPVASASLGQVHYAALADGQEVAVKVLRPGIDRMIETDLDILLELAAQAEKRTEWGRYYRVLPLAREFADTLRAEQNYEQEGLNMDRYRQMFAGVGYIRVPWVHWDTTTRRVLTMERIQGVKITDVARLEAAGMVMVVGEDARLGGIGTVGSVAVDGSGTLAPGMSAGTFTVYGLEMEKSTLEIEIEGDVASGLYDKLVVSDTLTALTESIQQALASGQQVTLIGFGTFYSRSHPAGKVHAVRSGAVMHYPATRRPAFRAGDLLKRAVRDRS